ncbi:glycosyl hydrolase family 28-related protein [Nocardioides sp. GY 10113]|uniref:glycosyl hydrolase family 28-related protein n=1 Tax=Nocardioides sp. GY 10113 TaxID=2569761 RepID=UPI00197D60A7|nr:glycosyl hydrolase family 28-related protein [Nocardioides sp. GY 10113]
MALALATVLSAAATTPANAAPAAAPPSTDVDLGPNVHVFDPSMSVGQIRAVVDQVANEQVGNEFGAERVALLFEPGTYGTPDEPLNFQVGYYTEVAGLGRSPGDVTINGSVYVRNQCGTNGCFALNNFWRSMSNLTINVTTPDFGCYSGQFWAVSQAAPLRRVHVKGQTTLMDYCTNPSFASGGFIADSAFDALVINGSQQQFYVRNTSLNGWSNGVWNQVFSGSPGAPPQCFPADPSCGGPYTTLPTTPASREKPYLYADSSGYHVFVPAAVTDSSGHTWSSGLTPGRSIDLSDFFVARPSDSAQTINAQLARGKNLLFTPGVYDITQTIRVKRADTVVLGLGLASLTPKNGVVPMTVADVPGVDIAGVTFDAGAQSSPVLLRVGTQRAAGSQAREHNGWSDPGNPTALQDVFFRIGGPYVGKAEVSLEVNSDHVILDDIWAWRADHGSGVGWTQNTADSGLIVNGDDVTATGLFVEHYQKTEVIWNGENGTVVFFQNEMPYDPPSQEAWRASPTEEGYPAFVVSPHVKHFTGYGMGSYSFFNQGVDIFASNAFEVPNTPGVRMHDLLTVFLDPGAGMGGIRNVINGTGGPSTIANADVPVTVVTYP